MARRYNYYQLVSEATDMKLLARKSTVVFLFMFLAFGCDQRSTPITNSIGAGKNVAVNPSSLAGLSTSQRTGDPNFQFKWKFDSLTFRIDGPAIPSDLISDLIGTVEDVSLIEGAWRIEDDEILFTVSRNGVAIESSMKVYQTGPIRIESSQAQYVFQTK